MIRRLISIAYLVIGLLEAHSHSYFTGLHALGPIVSVVLAVVLWPLLILGVNLHIA